MINESFLEAIIDENNLERELNGLKSAMKTTNTTNGFILTYNQEDIFGEIKAIPAWKWMRQARY